MFTNMKVEIEDFETPFKIAGYSSISEKISWIGFDDDVKFDISFGRVSRGPEDSNLCIIRANRYGIEWTIYIIGQKKIDRVKRRLDQDKMCMHQNLNPINTNEFIKNKILDKLISDPKLLLDCLESIFETGRQIGQVELQQQIKKTLGL